MIPASKDILSHLRIEHVFLTGERNCFCTPLALDEGVWRVATDVPLEAGEASINIKYKGAYIVVPVTLEREGDTGYLMTIVPHEVSGEEKELREGIGRLLEETALWDKRKEERWTVGAAGAPDFNLKRIEQKVLMDAQEWPCMVNDVSFQGMRITTLFTDGVKKDDEVTAVLHFIEPIEQIALRGRIQSMVIKPALEGNRNGRKLTFAILSIQFIDAPLSYKQRLGAYIKNKGNGLRVSPGTV